MKTTRGATGKVFDVLLCCKFTFTVLLSGNMNEKSLWKRSIIFQLQRKCKLNELQVFQFVIVVSRISKSWTRNLCLNFWVFAFVKFNCFFWSCRVDCLFMDCELGRRDLAKLNSNYCSSFQNVWKNSYKSFIPMGIKSSATCATSLETANFNGNPFFVVETSYLVLKNKSN